MAWDKSVSNTKAQINGDLIGGYLSLFGSPRELDADGEYFAPDTDFDTDLNNPPVLPALYHHNKNERIGRRQIGNIVSLEITEKGLWAEAELSEKGFYDEEVAKRKQYLEDIKRLVSEGHLGWSSGADPKRGIRKAPDGKIVRWPLLEGSFTPTPADPRNVIPTEKSYVKYLVTPDPEGELPEAPTGAAGAVTEDASFVNLNGGNKGVDVMTDTNNTALLDEIKALRGEMAGVLIAAQKGTGETHVKDTVKALEGKIEALETAMKNAPLVRGGAGGQQGNPAEKSLGDTLLSLKYGKPEGLKMDGLSGAAGAYLLPRRFGTEFLTIMQESSDIVRNVQIMPVSERAGDYPVVNIFGTVTGGATPLSGGLDGATREEGGAYTEENVTLEEISYRITNAVSGQVKVTRELVADSPIAIEALIRQAIQNEATSKAERFILRGTGVGQPLGILNSGALADVTPGTNNSFTRVDASNMASRLFKMGASKPAWLAHPSMMADIDALDISTGTSQIVMVGGDPTMFNFIKGSPVYYSHHLPVADASGAIILVDLSAYLLFQMTNAETGDGVQIRYFDQNSLTHDIWTYDMRLDGQPVMRSTISYSDSYTMSAFVRHND